MSNEAYKVLVFGCITITVWVLLLQEIGVI